MSRSDRRWSVTGTSATIPIAVIAIGCELVLDKLPIAPSRLSVPSLGARLLCAAFSGSVLVRAEGRSACGVTIVATGAAWCGAYAGHSGRVGLARHMPDAPVGVAEDILAIGLAVASVRAEDHS